MFDEEPEDIHGECTTEIRRLNAEIRRLSAGLKKANDYSEKFEREWYLCKDKLETKKVYVVWTDAEFSGSRVLKYGINKCFSTKDYAMKYLEDIYRDREWYRYVPFSEIEDLLESHIHEVLVEEY